MTLDSRDFFAPIIAFLFRRIRVFHALCVHDTEGCFLFPTIVGTDLSNYFFLTLDRVCSPALLFLRSRLQSRNERFSISESRSGAFSTDSRFLTHTALRRTRHRDRVFWASSSFLPFQGAAVSFETVS